MSDLPYAKQFFATARERYQIKLNREAGMPWPWTKDTHFQTWSFTNVHREDDKTTKWFRENIREPLMKNWREDVDFDERVRLVEATMIFRWFNRISTGEIIKDLLTGDGWDYQEAYRRLAMVDGPIITGAYIILGVPGQAKWEGVLEAIERARPQLPKMVHKWTYRPGSNPKSFVTLEEAWKDLKALDYIGPFMAYEIVMDLRYTPILDQATDVMTWGNLGPGATRGMSWVMYGNADSLNAGPKTQKMMLGWMQELLEMSKQEEYWPQAWPHWELHEVEMWLCEFSKYMRAHNGMRQKRKYQHP